MVTEMNEEEIKEENEGEIRIKKHSHRKIRILKKYLKPCIAFSKKHGNFAYIDTHGGTGKIIDDDSGEKIDGSVLTYAKTELTWPCYCVEINPERFTLLQESTKEFPNIKRFNGDCNVIIDEILNEIQPGEKFIFCFIDPDGLVYGSGKLLKYQITWKTIEKIANFPRTEILMNFYVNSVIRNSALYHKDPKNPAYKKVGSHLTMLFGSEKWKDIGKGEWRKFVRLFIDERFKKFKYKGAILIRQEGISKGPLYYLVFGSKKLEGGKIMRDIMMKEWKNKTRTLPLPRYQYKTQKEWLDVYYPLNSFIFED